MTDSAHFKRYEFLRTVGMYPERQAAINRRLGKHRVDHRAKALTERRAS